jgi:hypothetical protein
VIVEENCIAEQKSPASLSLLISGQGDDANETLSIFNLQR